MRLKYVTVLEVAWKWVLENLILGLARKKIILKWKYRGDGDWEFLRPDDPENKLFPKIPNSSN